MKNRNLILFPRNRSTPDFGIANKIFPAFRNRSGDITITILVVEILFLCTFALGSFVASDSNVRNSFVGIGEVQKLNSMIEKNYFYGEVLGEVGISESGDLYRTIDYASKNKLGNRICSCGDSCNSYATFILETASEYGIDSFMFLSLMMQESDCVSSAFSGSSTGLMQINLIHCGKYGLLADKDKCKEQLLNNIQLNIEVGAKILKESYEASKDGRIFQGCSNRGITYFGWEAALRGYNGWGCGTDSSGNKIYSQDSYVEEVVERTALLKKSVNYVETDSTTGFLWWKKSDFAFSVEYLGE